MSGEQIQGKWFWVQNNGECELAQSNLGCLENSDLENSDPRPEKLRPSGVSKTQTQKTQTLGCLENSDPKTQTLWVSRKLRPEK